MVAGARAASRGGGGATGPGGGGRTTGWAMLGWGRHRSLGYAAVVGGGGSSGVGVAGDGEEGRGRAEGMVETLTGVAKTE